MKRGVWPVAGLDEAGRGPLAGPVMAAAVILDPKRIPKGLDDSKRLSHERARRAVRDHPEEGAGRLVRLVLGRDDRPHRHPQGQPRGDAPRRARPGAEAAAGAGRRARRAARTDLRGQAVVKGDQRSQSIAAASIVAKVMRDRMMATCGAIHVDYGFELHMGYATERHRAAIEMAGACARLHRLSFSPFRLGAEVEVSRRAGRDRRQFSAGRASSAACLPLWAGWRLTVRQLRGRGGHRSPHVAIRRTTAPHQERGSSLVQLGLDRRQRILEQLGAGLLVELRRKHRARRLGGDVDGDRADLVDRIAFGLADLLLGKRGAAGDVFFGLLVRFLDERSLSRLAAATMSAASFSASLRFFWYSASSCCASSRSFCASSRSSRILAARSSSALAIIARHLQIDDDAEEDEQGDHRPDRRLRPWPAPIPERP